MKITLTIAIFFLTFNGAYASPWFTGPLLASSGKTIPLGHANLEMYGFFTKNHGEFNRHWKLVPSPGGEVTQFNPLLSYGLADWVDTQFSAPYTINRRLGKTGRHLGDVSALLGFQLLKQKTATWSPDLRLTIQQIFPTGRFENLSPENQGTDITGLGSYQTNFGLNFQYLYWLGSSFYLQTRLNLNYQYAQSVNLNGLSAFGGNTMTKGKVKPGNLASIDLSSELSLTQNWVIVMEGFFFNQHASRFQGITGANHQGLPLMIGHGGIEEFSLAPAIEYNFSSNYGLIAGAWFAVKGKDAPNFISTVVAFNAYW